MREQKNIILISDNKDLCQSLKRVFEFKRGIEVLPMTFDLEEKPIALSFHDINPADIIMFDAVQRRKRLHYLICRMRNLFCNPFVLIQVKYDYNDFQEYLSFFKKDSMFHSALFVPFSLEDMLSQVDALIPLTEAQRREAYDFHFNWWMEAIRKKYAGHDLFKNLGSRSKNDALHTCKIIKEIIPFDLVAIHGAIDALIVSIEHLPAFKNGRIRASSSEYKKLMEKPSDGGDPNFLNFMNLLPGGME